MENSREDRVNILKIECYITINDEEEPILNIGTSFSNMIKSEEFKYYNDELHKNIKPVLNDLKQMLLNTLEMEEEWKMKNSIEENIKNAEHFINSIKTDKEYKEENGWHGYYNKEIVELARMLEYILSAYKRVLKINEVLLKENEELKIKNNAIKRESEAYAENMIRLDNELNLEKEKSKYEWIRQNCLPQELVNKLYIPIQKVKDKIRHYQELQDNYIKKYDETNEGLQAMINVLQELLEGRK